MFHRIHCYSDSERTTLRDTALLEPLTHFGEQRPLSHWSHSGYSDSDVRSFDPSGAPVTRSSCWGREGSELILLGLIKWNHAFMVYVAQVSCRDFLCGAWCCASISSLGRRGHIAGQEHLSWPQQTSSPDSARECGDLSLPWNILCQVLPKKGTSDRHSPW